MNAKLDARAAASQGPQRFVTLTRVGDDWQTVRRRMKALADRLRANGLGVEWWWSVERNPKGTGHHVHALQHGDYLDMQLLRREARREGMGGWARPELIRSVRAATGYALKAAGYIAKESAVSLAINGGRVGHSSRGYWREPGGKRAARARELKRFLEREGDKAWILERESWVPASSSCSVRTDIGSSSTWVRPARINAPGRSAPGPSDG